MDDGDLIYFVYDEDMDLIDLELSEESARASAWPGCTIEAHKYDPYQPRLTITIEEN
jgi:hypothetical protein